IPNLCQVFATSYRYLPFFRRRSHDIQREAEARLWTALAWHGLCRVSANREFFLGIKSNHVCGSRVVGDRIGMECVATPNCGYFGLLCAKPNQLKQDA